RRVLDPGRVSACPVVEALAAAEPARMAVERRVRIVGMRARHALVRADEVARMAPGPLRREQDLEAAVLRDLQLGRVEPAHLHLHAGPQLGEAARVAREAAV